MTSKPQQRSCEERSSKYSWKGLKRKKFQGASACLEVRPEAVTFVTVVIANAMPKVKKLTRSIA